MKNSLIARIADYAVLILCLVLAGGLPVSAAARKQVVLIKTMPVPVVNRQCEWFVTYLGRLGYQPGVTLDLRIFEAQGDRRRAERFLTGLLKKSRPDLVVTSATLASQAAYKVLKETSIPMVFLTVSDPVGAGLINTVGELTGSNVTGKVHMICRVTRTEIVRKLIKGLPGKRPFRIGLIHSTYPSAMGDLRELNVLGDQLPDISFYSFPVTYKKVPEGLPAMFDDVRKRIRQHQDEVDFWWQLSGPLGELQEFTNILLHESHRPIVMGLTKKSVQQGALVHLTPSIEGTGKEAAMLADMILTGTDPGEIPVTPPSQVDLGINLTTALKLGIVIPPDILSLACDNIFR